MELPFLPLSLQPCLMYSLVHFIKLMSGLIHWLVGVLMFINCQRLARYYLNVKICLVFFLPLLERYMSSFLRLGCDTGLGTG